MYWNDNDLIVEPYERVQKYYYCGKDLLQFKEGKTLMYTILVIDLDECYCADVFSDGEIVKLFNDTSMVPHKMGVGGQSALRFSQNRQNEIVHWFKNINEMLKMYNREITLGINHVYERRFIGYLNTYNKQKIKTVISNEYSGLAGIYDTINRLEAK